MPARDRRPIGELLADSDALSRETLLDVSASQGPAMVRTWGQVVQSAARLWATLPPISVAAPSGPDLMVRLRVVGTALRAARRLVAGLGWGRWINAYLSLLATSRGQPTWSSVLARMSSQPARRNERTLLLLAPG